ncbi:MAG TPA: archease [Pseudonocardiaceae bacterium]|nr:archease [Pseudonocardiaceae bacterium]
MSNSHLERGHRTLPHTADLRIEAWAPTREACLAESVLALVASFADTIHAEPGSAVTVKIAAQTDQDALVAVLDEVIYLLDTQAAVPVGVEVGAARDGLSVHLQLAPLDGVELIGAVPKAVTLHHLEIARSPQGWCCGVTVDV